MSEEITQEFEDIPNIKRSADKYSTEYFGTKSRQDLFYIPTKVAFTDQTKRGAIPKFVMRKKFEKSEEIESRLSCYSSEQRIDDAVKVMDGIAAEFNFDLRNATFTNSCYESIQIALKSLQLKSHNRLLIMSDCGAIVREVTKGACDNIGCVLDVLQVPMPLTKMSFLLDLFEETFAAYQYRAVILEHIAPRGGVLYPIDLLTRICKRYNVATIIDGSYAIGQIPIDFRKLDVDIYIGNFYRWYFACRGVSFIYASNDFKTHLCPLVDYPHRENKQEMLLQTFYRHYEAQVPNIVTIGFGREFMTYVGGLVIVAEYNCKLLRWAVHYLQTTWNSKPLKITRTMRAPFMAFVRLPICIERYLISMYGPKKAHREFVKLMMTKYNVATGAKIIDNSLFCRITAQIYNTKKDYELLANKVLEVNNELRITSYLPTK